MATKEYRQELLNKHAQLVAELSELLRKGTMNEVEAKEAELKENEKEYKKLREKEVFASLLDTHAALVQNKFDTVGHEKVAEEGRTIGAQETIKWIQIDMKKFCEHKGFSLDWYYEAQAFGLRLTLRVAETLGLSKTDLKKINDSYFMDELARAVQLGQTPTSDTQCVKHLQKVLDLLAPGSGKVHSQDVYYILYCSTKKYKKGSSHGISCAKANALLSHAYDAFNRIVTDGHYTVDYKAAVKADEAVKPETPKAEPKPKKATKKAAAKAETTEPETVVVEKPEN